MNTDQRLIRLFFLCTGACGFLLIWWSSPYGAGTTPDSIHYLKSAESIGHSANPFLWGRHWPPAYPLVLGILNVFVNDMQLSPRILQAALFAVNSVLVGVIVGRSTQGAFVISALSSIYFIVQGYGYDIHYLILSEGLFISFLLLHIIAIQSFLCRPSFSLIALAACAAGFGTLTRYAGISFIFSSGLFLLLSGTNPLKKRVQYASAFVLIAIAVPVIWLIASHLTQPGDSARALVVHRIDLGRILSIVYVFAGWFYGGIIGIGCLLFSVIFILKTFEDLEIRKNPFILQFNGLLLVSVVIYLFFIITSISLFDYYTPVDIRIMFPAVVLFWIAFAGLVGNLGAERKYAKIAGISSIAVIIILCGSGLMPRIMHNKKIGVGYYAKDVREMPILSYIRDTKVPLIYSNAPELISVYFQKKTVFLPRFVETSKNLYRTEYGNEMDSMLDNVRTGNACIVYFDKFSFRNYLPGRSVFAGLSGISTKYDSTDGVIYSGPQMVHRPY